MCTKMADVSGSILNKEVNMHDFKRQTTDFDDKENRRKEI